MKGKILVTGGTGFIGSHTTVELQQAGYEVVIIDNLSNSNIEVLDGIERITGIRPAFVEGDCTDRATVRKLFEDHPGIAASSTLLRARLWARASRSPSCITATTSTSCSTCSN